ncbi:MAG: NDP-sugar synthase [Dehalococcoidia bacterium]|nr:NDP-sugar synthase [Dehalococcoidia bacterium]
MRAVILAGGEATRLHPLTLTVPKALVPVLNRPFIEHMLAHLGRHGVTQALFTLGHRADEIVAHFPTARFNRMRLRFAREETPLGTAGGVGALATFLEDTFLVLNGDIFTDLDLTGLVAFHKKQGAVATIALTSVEDPSAYGLVEARPSGRVTRFVEKPPLDQVTSTWINAGTYVLEPSVLRLIPQGRRCSFERDVFPALLQKGARVFAYRSDAFWSDLGTPERYHQLHRDLLHRRVPQSWIRGHQLKPGVWEQSGCVVHGSARVEGPALLGSGCRVEGNAVLVGPLVLGDGVLVGANARVADCVIWPGARIGRDAVVEGAILGRNVRIGRGSSVGPGCVLADGVVVGKNSRLKQGVTLAPGQQVEDGAVSSAR